MFQLYLSKHIHVYIFPAFLYGNRSAITKTSYHMNIVYFSSKQIQHGAFFPFQLNDPDVTY